VMTFTCWRYALFHKTKKVQVHYSSENCARAGMSSIGDEITHDEGMNERSKCRLHEAC
jgi:hypothetical protein